MYSCFSPLVQGFFERGKWSIVSEGKCCWRESRKWSDGRLFAIGRDVECRLRGLEAKGLALKQNPVKEMTVF